MIKKMLSNVMKTWNWKLCEKDMQKTFDRKQIMYMYVSQNEQSRNMKHFFLGSCPYTISQSTNTSSPKNDFYCTFVCMYHRWKRKKATILHRLYIKNGGKVNALTKILMVLQKYDFFCLNHFYSCLIQLYMDIYEHVLHANLMVMALYQTCLHFALC